MCDESRIQELVERILGSDLTPEEAAGDNTEVLNAVRERLRRYRQVDAEIEALFPSKWDALASSVIAREPYLPKIPGYEIQSIIGHGGMGIVYKAMHLRLDRFVAIKMLIAGPFAGPRERGRFVREAKSIAALRHPNIVQIYDVGDVEERGYYTMEYCEGGTLAQKLEGKLLGPSEAARHICTLAQAIEMAHAIGIIHRDLKPGNVLLTADGGLKISDFGLARRSAAEPSITLDGARVGTPGYMSPEQVSGSAGTLSSAVDIYALGAILYEMLTGRPPFLGKNPAETQQRILLEDPVPPARVNPGVPRDLDTICLKCLQKDPQRRYNTAHELAADLRRFERHEPIAARPVGSIERTYKWVRRHPALAATLATILLVLVGIIWGGAWLTTQHAKLTHAVEMDLAEVASLQKQARWSAARASLDRSTARLNGGGPEALRQRIAQASRDLDLVMKLDKIRMNRLTGELLVAYRQEASRRYTDAFRDAQLGTFRDQPADVASRVLASPVRLALVAALDDWALCPSEKQQQDWVLAAARAANTADQNWASRIYQPNVWNDPEALRRIADVIPADTQPLPLLLSLGERQLIHDSDVSGFLRRVQAEYPADFWANFTLGNVLLLRSPVEARGYYRAALTARPDLAVAYCAVGDTYVFGSSVDDAVHYYEKSIRLDPNYGRGYCNLGLARQFQGRLDEAIDLYRKSIELDPNYVWSYYNFARISETRGNVDLALSAYQKALALDPGNTSVKQGIRSVLVRQGHGEDVLKQWRDDIAKDPDEFNEWWGYAELALFLGKESDYREVRRGLLHQFGSTTDPMIAEKVGRACLMLPGSEEEMRSAAALTNISFSASATLDDEYAPYFSFAQALADYRLGHMDKAAINLHQSNEKILWPCLPLLRAMIQYRQGDEEGAKKTLAYAIDAYNWAPAQADTRDAWLAHILRREAELLIFPDIPQILAGSAEPQDNHARLALIGVCEFQGLHTLEAHTLSNAFADDPTLLDNPAVDLRYTAARAAAMVSGMSADRGTPVTEAERSHWRKQAIDWLTSDLARKMKSVNLSDRTACIRLKEELMLWQYESDFAALRDATGLQNMNAADRADCLAFWKNVGDAIARLDGPK